MKIPPLEFEAELKKNASSLNTPQTPYVLGIDLEGINLKLQSRGLVLEKDRVIEIGAVLWDWKECRPAKIFSELIDEKDRPPISEELYELTGIDDELMKNFALRDEDEIARALTGLNELFGRAHFIMAHNGGNYDRPMLEALYKRFNLRLPPKTWIDSGVDIEYPKRIKKRGLASLEYDHGFINPFPHRALGDAFSMLKIASNYSLNRMVMLAKSPRIIIKAKLNAPNWKDPLELEQFQETKAKVGRAGFQWRPLEKIWIREVPKILLDEQTLKFDFEFEIHSDAQKIL